MEQRVDELVQICKDFNNPPLNQVEWLQQANVSAHLNEGIAQIFFRDNNDIQVVRRNMMVPLRTRNEEYTQRRDRLSQH